MDKAKKIRLTQAPYNWLKASPLLTLPTLFFVASLGIGNSVCSSGVIYCDYSSADYINFTFGVIASAIWHLVLLQYLNNKDSELVRMHGRRALIQAGIRTGAALGAVFLDWSTNASGSFACLAVIALLLIWAVNMAFSKNWVESSLPITEQDTDEAPKPSVVITLQRPTPEMLAETLEGLQSADDVVVLQTLNKLETFSSVNEEILKELENLADEDENMDIRMDARVAFNRLKAASQPVSIEPMESNMNENEEGRKPQDILNELLEKLHSTDDGVIASALAALNSLSYSSDAIRRQVEILSVRSDNGDIRNSALALLNTAPNRAVQRRVMANKMDRGIRYALLQELNEWVKSSLIDSHNAEVIRRRYDFDFNAAPQTAPAPVAATQAESTPKAETPAPIAAPSPQVPPEPRPSLLQTLTSEASIKIYLYLGAFFVIAAAAILGAVVPELRLPILFIGTLIFGGLSVAIKKRLPQPSFALFIVFSFLLPITANSLHATLQDTFDLPRVFTDAYWVVVFLLMAIIWSGSTWLYESRLFSLTAFGSLILAFVRIGTVFEAEGFVYALLMGLAALFGLAGTWLLKRWKDNKFALPIFIAAQVLQVVALIVSFSFFGLKLIDTRYQNLWHLVNVATWGLGAVFYVLSNRLYPFAFFPWLASAMFIPMPWFIAAGFDLESLGSTIVLFVWGAILAVTSEILRRLELTMKYGLPILLASLPSVVVAVITGFAYETWLGLVVALGIAILYSALHILKSRWWLWTFALLNALIAYFAFFQLEFVDRLGAFVGYQVIAAIILFLLPDLILAKDWKASLPWRLPLRIYGAAMTLYISLALLAQDQSGHVAVCYGILAIFFAVYALAYRNSFIGYLPTAYLPLAFIFALDAFNVDAWLPVLSALVVLYYLAGFVIRKWEKWSATLRYSSLALGTLIVFAALIDTKATGGWYALIIGLLFIAEMYLSKNGLFEVGAPILFTAGIFLILNDFDVERTSYHLLAYSLVWILSDLLAHLTFTNPRPLSLLVRIVGGLIALTNYAILLNEDLASVSAIGFAVYTLLFLTVSLLYRQSKLFYAFTLTLPLFVIYFFRIFDITQWIHPVIVVAMLYYVAGTFLRYTNRAQGWDQTLLYSGLGVGVAVSFAAPILGGLDASIPVAIAATLWAFEAFSKRNAWLAFPANALYLLAYLIILFELDVTEPQFFSIGTALFGLIQHYLLTRAESKTGAFIMGMFSQFVLLGTTYIEMIDKNALGYFFLLFVQSLVILVYGLVIRSRSLTFFPIGFVVLGVITVVYSALKGIGTIFVIGCTGIVLLMLGIAAVLMRERIAKLGEKLSDWKA